MVNETPLEEFKVTIALPSSSVPTMTGAVCASLCVFVATLTLSYANQAVYVSNLDNTCLNCICMASTGCNEDYKCSPEGHCGPFFISRKYWEEGGRTSLSSLHQDGGHEGCARDLPCATKVVSNFMLKNGRDCNADGVTDCDDYARVHYLGGTRCSRNIDDTKYYQSFRECWQLRTSISKDKH